MMQLTIFVGTAFVVVLLFYALWRGSLKIPLVKAEDKRDDPELEQAADDLQYAIRWFFHMWASRHDKRRWDKTKWTEYMLGLSHHGDGSLPYSFERYYPVNNWPKQEWFWKSCKEGTQWLIKRWFQTDLSVKALLQMVKW
jgi:hypothetical protein